MGHGNQWPAVGAAPCAEEQVPLEREDVASLHPNNSTDVLGPVCSEQDLSGAKRGFGFSRVSRSARKCDDLHLKVGKDIAKLC